MQRPEHARKPRLRRPRCPADLKDADGHGFLNGLGSPVALRFICEPLRNLE